MAYFSSAAASTLTRPRVAIALVSVFTAASLGYYFYQTSQYSASDPDFTSTGPGLHRRNALRRPRRSSHRLDDSSESESHGDENLDASTAVPSRGAPAQSDDQNPDEWYNDNSQAPRQRTGENIVTLLFRVSEDNARRNAYVHRGCQCNGCGMVPIRGIRYRCANCADFDLCEVCESQGLHNKTHVFYKVKVPAPPFGTRHVQPAWYPGDPDNSIRNLPRYLLAKWSRDTGFERVELDAFWEQWTFMANTEWRDDPDGLGLAMDRKTFERCLVPSGGYRHAAPNLIHDRMFAFYDTNHDDLIGFEEFLHGVSYRKRKDKLRRTFDGYDIDGDGYVSRRDFLRMFRAYYVLYKQMHKDILDGLDDHMMTTTEAQQLINGRQPLSSLFGREGRVPPADHSRPMEGKVFRSNGDVEVNDGKGVVNEDKLDTSNREEILSSLFARNGSQSFFTESFGSSARRPQSPNGDSRYWSGIINPPHNTVDLASLIAGDYTQLDDLLESIRHESLDDNAESGSSDEDRQSESGERAADDVDGAEQPDADAVDEPAGPAGPAATRAIPDASRFTNTLPTESQLRVQHQAIVANSHRLGIDKRKRIVARKQLLERWKRRQFYLDEEEGALPPQGWDENQDVLLHLNGMNEPSKSAPHFLSPRSRSSSKVRFAEDADDFETRSNPSTSSRSVPERWGGMEIPDAERDAGKEILYQVTQQAFNELLDEIFKTKEDLAVRAAETKEQREEYRELLDSMSVENDDEDEDEDEESISQSPQRPQAPAPDESRPIRNQSLGELLTVSGYSVGPSAEDDGQLESDSPLDLDVEARPAVKETATPAADMAPAESSEYRDPTMPQNRPNRLTQTPPPCSVLQSEEGDSINMRIANGSGPSETAPGTETKNLRPESPARISHSTLKTWKRLDLAEQEARDRGGWGRLSYEEFEEIYREHEFQDSGRNRLDYLGSWIDFCIP